jgi:hypothetical protein
MRVPSPCKWREGDAGQPCRICEIQATLCPFSEQPQAGSAGWRPSPCLFPAPLTVPRASLPLLPLSVWKFLSYKQILKEPAQP